MAYTTGLLKERVSVLNREEASAGRFGRDSSGVTWEESGTVWASVDWAKGKQAMNAGALDVYAVNIVRMRWNDFTTMRSRIQWRGNTYQILADTFHADYQANTIQFHIQLVVD